MSEITEFLTQKLEFMPSSDEFSCLTQINPLKVREEMLNQPSLYARCAERFAKATKQYESICMYVETLEKTLYVKVLAKLEADGKKPTQAYIQARVETQEIMKEGNKKRIEAKQILELNKQLLESLRQRKDMLVQLSVNQREEMKNSVAFT